MVLDHSGVFVQKDKQAEVVNWYTAALLPLGYKKLISKGPNDEVFGFSDNGKSADWWPVSRLNSVSTSGGNHSVETACDPHNFSPAVARRTVDEWKLC
jgi:hypothetical protein